ncbi:MAG: hypothetical protein ABH829_05190 [archaeon]
MEGDTAEHAIQDFLTVCGKDYLSPENRAEMQKIEDEVTIIGRLRTKKDTYIYVLKFIKKFDEPVSFKMLNLAPKSYLKDKYKPFILDLERFNIIQIDRSKGERNYLYSLNTLG